MKNFELQTTASLKLKNAILNRMIHNSSLQYKIFEGYAIFNDGIILNPLGKEVKESYKNNHGKGAIPLALINGKEVNKDLLIRRAFYHGMHPTIVERIKQFGINSYKPYGKYAVFNDGKIFSGRTGKPLSYLNDMSAVMIFDGKPTNVYPHEIIAELFVPNPHNKKAVEFINKDRTDKRPENLRWVDSAFYSGKQRVLGMGYLLDTPSKMAGDIKAKLDANQDLNYVTFYGHTVFEDGTVYGKTGRLLKPNYCLRGCGTIRFYIDSKYYHLSISKIIALCFVPNENNYQFIGYKDGDKFNCRASNLYWVETFARKNNIIPLSDEESRKRVKHIDRSAITSLERIVIYDFQTGDKAAILSYFFDKKDTLLSKLYYAISPYGTFDDAYELFHSIIEKIEKSVSAFRINVPEDCNSPLMRMFNGQAKWHISQHFRNLKREVRLTERMPHCDYDDAEIAGEFLSDY